jgi:acetyl-CoA synthetase
MYRKYVSKVDFESYQDFYENFKINIPENFNFAYDVVDEIANKTPNKTAIVWCNEKGEEAIFSFGELKKKVDKTANFLKSLGIVKGDKVMTILKRRYEFWFIILALHKLGAICIPATHLLTAKDITYRNNKAGIKMIICVADSRVIENVENAEPKSPTLSLKVLVGGKKEGWGCFEEGLGSASEIFVRPTGSQTTTNQDTCLLYFTSGTTGMPKIVSHNFTYPFGHIVTARYWQNVQEGGLHLTVAETGWAKAVWGKIYGQWLCGSAVFVYDCDRFIPKEMLAVVAKYGVTTFCAPPTVYRFFIKEDLKSYDLSKLKHCSVAGEPLNPEVYEQFLNATGIKLLEGYGQTELTLTVATFPWMQIKPGSMGKPCPGYEIDLLDETGRSVKAGEQGQIVVRTNKNQPIGMFDGYYGDKELTERVWDEDIYYTGDMAYKDNDGYLWFIGRADDVIKSSGYRIGPFEVESALLEHPAVLECAVTGVPDPERGQVVKATVVLAQAHQDKASDNLVNELQNHVKKITAPYKYPRVIEFVKELPKTISGKIRRVEIRENDTK